MNLKIKIDNYLISENRPCFIIAEAGVNHNGSLIKAFKLVDEAIKVGANSVKFQTFSAKNLVFKNSPKANYQLKTTKKSENQFSMLKNLELNHEEQYKLFNYCKKKKIIFLSTPYNFEDVEFLIKLKTSAFKLASMHMAEPYFIKQVAKLGKPCILSTGMANLGEIKKTFQEIKKTKNRNIALLQCTTDYPAASKEINLNVIKTLKKNFKCIVGFSDHTSGNTASISSIPLGAKVIEKHFTLSNNLSGPDHKTSLNPKDFKKFVSKIRESEVLLGTDQKLPTISEKKNLFAMRRSIVTKKEIKKGEKIKENYLTYKRPLAGIKPIYLKKILGKKVKKTLKKDTILKWKYF